MPYDAILLAGDIHSAKNSIQWISDNPYFIGKPVFYVAGNHEFWNGETIQSDIELIRSNSKIAKRSAGHEIYFLENDEAILCVEDENIRVIGATLWTDFALMGLTELTGRYAEKHMDDYWLINETKELYEAEKSEVSMKDWDRKRLVGQYVYKYLTSKTTMSMHHKSKDFLRSKLKQTFDGKTVVLTHHAPHIKSVAPRFLDNQLTPAFASDLTELLFMGADLWVHGHMHESFDYCVGNTRVVCNPHGMLHKGSGLSENRNFDPHLIIEI